MDTPIGQFPTPQPPPEPSKEELEAWAKLQEQLQSGSAAKASNGEEVVEATDGAKKMTAVVNPNAESQKDWWKIPGVKGMKEHVAAHIRSIKGIPDHWQQVIQTEIAAHPAAAVQVHAHFMVQNHRTLATQPIPKMKIGSVELTGAQPPPVQQPSTRGRIVLHLDISPLEGFVGAEG